MSLYVQAMKNFIIKSHKTNKSYSKPHFFILCKGMNSGKPLKTPCSNCFVIQFESETDRNEAYFIAKCLWMSRFWHQYLVGSVIPFIRIGDFKKVFSSKANEMNKDKLGKVIQVFNLLENQEVQLVNQLGKINELKKGLFIAYTK